MTRDQFIYALTACGCLLKDGKTWYEHDELIKCFEDLGLFEQEPFINKPCISSGVCEHDKQKVLDKIRAEIAELPEEMGNILNLETGEVIGKYISSIKVLQIIDKYKADSEE